MSMSNERTLQQLKELYAIEIIQLPSRARKDADKKVYFEMWELYNRANPREKPLKIGKTADEDRIAIARGQERKELKNRLRELRKIGLGGSIATYSYRIVSEEDLKSKNIKLIVPLEEIDGTKDIVGLTDAVMLQTVRDFELFTINLIFEFKTCATLYDAKSHYRAIFELIGRRVFF